MPPGLVEFMLTIVFQMLLVRPSLVYFMSVSMTSDARKIGKSYGTKFHGNSEDARDTDALTLAPIPFPISKRIIEDVTESNL